jgi:hypothetical protein
MVWEATSFRLSAGFIAYYIDDGENILSELMLSPKILSV